MPMHNAGGSLDPESIQDPKRTYRKKKTWNLCLHITIETPELDHKLKDGDKEQENTSLREQLNEAVDLKERYLM